MAVFASGFGTNLARIHREILEGGIGGAELALVVSNNSQSGALEYARTHGIASVHLSLASCGNDSTEYENALMEEIAKHRIDLVALAGFLKKLPDGFIRAFENRILNVHPALLPSFGGSGMYGLRVHNAVLARGCKVSGASVHFVSEEYDSGPIVLQKCCEILDDDTPESLQQRVRDIEFDIFPKAIALLAQDKLIVENNRVYILP